MAGWVSQSENDTFLTCERRHYYAFGEKLQRKRYGLGLQRGIIGHTALAIYYTPLIRIKPTPDEIAASLKGMTQYLDDELTKWALAGDLELVEVITALRKRLVDYVTFYADEFIEWEVLSVEHEFNYEDFPFKPDLIKRHRLTNEVRLVDHKFLYNFYSGGKVTLFPQLPKYVGALRDLGYRVDSAEYNMIRHRKDAVEKFRRMKVDIPQTRIDNYQHEQEVVTRRINSLKAMGVEEWEQNILRTANSFTCPMCPFADLCQTDLDNLPGRDLLVRTDFEPNTYGYREYEDADSGS